MPAAGRQGMADGRGQVPLGFPACGSAGLHCTAALRYVFLDATWVLQAQQMEACPARRQAALRSRIGRWRLSLLTPFLSLSFFFFPTVPLFIPMSWPQSASPLVQLGTAVSQLLGRAVGACLASSGQHHTVALELQQSPQRPGLIGVRGALLNCACSCLQAPRAGE